jgi:hypothetical protein
MRENIAFVICSLDHHSTAITTIFFPVCTSSDLCHAKLLLIAKEWTVIQTELSFVLYWVSKQSWTLQQTVATRRYQNRSNDLIHGGRWWWWWWVSKHKATSFGWAPVPDWTGVENLGPHRDSIPGPPSTQRVAIPTELSRPPDGTYNTSTLSPLTFNPFRSYVGLRQTLWFSCSRRFSWSLTLTNPIFLPPAYSPALIYFGRERGWWITCNYPTVLKEKNGNRKRTTCAICWLKSVLHEEKRREQKNHNVGTVRYGTVW